MRSALVFAGSPVTVRAADVVTSVIVCPLDVSILLERGDLRDRVYELVLDMLMTSDLACPSAALPAICTSHSPVRETLLRHERTGPVTRGPQGLSRRAHHLRGATRGNVRRSTRAQGWRDRLGDETATHIVAALA